MKRNPIIMLVVCLMFSTTFAADYIRLDADAVDPGTTVTLDFIVTRECPIPTLIAGASNGFEMTATGSATWTFNDLVRYHDVDWFNLGGLLFSNYIDGVSPDTFLTGGAALMTGMPIVTEEPYFGLVLDFGAGDGQLCIDSSFVAPAGAWKWSLMTCGLGGAPDRPLFLDIGGSDANHPVCIAVGTPCPDPLINVTPPGDELAGSHCSGSSFAFAADPGEGQTIVGWTVISGIGSIDGSGYYSVGAQPSGAYPVVIQVENSCASTDDYAFTVILTNENPIWTNTGAEPTSITAGQLYSYDFDATDSDACDDLEYGISFVTPTPTNSPTMDGLTGLFEWQTDSADGARIFEFEIVVEDGEPGAKGPVFYGFAVEVLEPECPAPTINVTPPGDLLTGDNCNGAAFQFSADPGGAPITGWAVTAGPGSIDGNGYYTLYPAAVGTFPVTVRVTNGCPESDEYSFEVTIVQDPVCDITATPGLEMCQGGMTIELCAPVGMAAYFWTGTGAIDTDPTARCITVGGSLSPGIFSYQVLITNADSCWDSCSVEITVLANPACDITADPGFEICDGATTVLCAPVGTAVSYLWTGTGAIDTDSTTRCITVGGGLTPGIYTYMVTVTDSNGCESTCSEDVTVYANPVCEIVADPGFAICEGSSTVWCASEGGPGGYTYQWDGPGGFSASTRCIEIGQDLSPGSYTYVVTIVDENGCESSCSENLTVYANPPCEIDAVPGDVIFEGDSALFCAPEGPYEYEWFGPGVSGATERCVSVGEGLAPGIYTYTVAITDLNGCQSECSRDLTVLGLEPIIQLDPDFFYFVMDEGGPNPPGQVLTISNTGSGTLNWEMGETADWLMASDSIGTAPSTVALDVDGIGLPIGLYGDTVSVSGNAANSPQYFLALLEIQPGFDCGDATILMDPDSAYVYQAFAMDPIYYSIFVGDFEFCEVPLIDLPTVQVIGDIGTVNPIDVEILGSYPGFVAEVLAISFTAADFFDAYGLLWDWSIQTFTVNGTVADSIPFSVSGQVMVRGHRLGDANFDGNVDIDDVVFLAHYMFSNGPAPLFEEPSDLDASGSLDIDDIIHLIRHIFDGKRLPRDPDGDGKPDF